MKQLVVAALVALACGNGVGAKEKNPTSKLYVAGLTGDAEIDTGERIEDLDEKSVHNAQGTVIETKPTGSNAMVFSNGMGVYLIPDSRMEVNKFRQEPFIPNRTDLETEPSISQTAMNVSRGAVGICPARLVAGSSMVFSTPAGSVSVRSGNLVVESDENETRISLISGDVTVRAGENDSGGTQLADGQQAVISHGPNGETSITLRPIPAEVRPQMEDYASMACMARRTVYFDVDDKKNNGADDGPSVFNRESASGNSNSNSTNNGDRTKFGSDDDETTDVLVPVTLVPTDPPGTTAGSSTSQPVSASTITTATNG